jgi:hypothetical protein
VTCGTQASKVRCKVVVGGGEARAARAQIRLRLARAGRLYATGARLSTGHATRVHLHALRRLRPGRYVLTVVVGDVRVKLGVRI